MCGCTLARAFPPPPLRPWWRGLPPLSGGGWRARGCRAGSAFPLLCPQKMKGEGGGSQPRRLVCVGFFPDSPQTHRLFSSRLSLTRVRGVPVCGTPPTHAHTPSPQPPPAFGGSTTTARSVFFVSPSPQTRLLSLPLLPHHSRALCACVCVDASPAHTPPPPRLLPT